MISKKAIFNLFILALLYFLLTHYINHAIVENEMFLNPSIETPSKGNTSIIPKDQLPHDFPKFRIEGESSYHHNFFISPQIIEPNLSYMYISNYKGEVLWYRKNKFTTDNTKVYLNSKGFKRYTYIECIPELEPLSEGNMFYELVVLDENFQEIDRVRTIEYGIVPGNSGVNHDYFFVDDGHYYLPSAFIPDGSNFIEFAIQEVKNGEVLWAFISTDLPEFKELSLNLQIKDYIHFNSMNIDTDGNLLVSLRHAGIFKLDKETKQIKWFIGKNRNDFNFNSTQIPYWQHDIELYTDGSISVWDNSGSETDHSRVLHFKLDEENLKVEFYEEFVYFKQVKSPNMGGARILDDEAKIINIAYGGDYLLNQPAYEEYDFRNNKSLMNITFESGYQFFRVFRDTL